MNALSRLQALGQSCWLDDLSRRIIADGEFARLVREGVHGVTSNPATFAKAISGGGDYDRRIEALAAAGASAAEIYDRLSTDDVRDACDILRPVYDRTHGIDGFVSLEVSPHLAHDTEASVAEAKRLWTIVDRPNLFIKIPGTEAGVPAIEEALYEGVNINITLLFSVPRYEAVADAYMRALERRIAAHRPIDRLASVASFFLSRIDVRGDELLQHRGAAGKPLLGKVAIANAKLAYRSFERMLAGRRWQRLAANRARVQRVLWASTSTKNPDYPDLMYVEPLIGPDTINTMPLQTIKAFLDHGKVAETLRDGVDQAGRNMAELGRLGISFDRVATQLENEGVQKFIEPFDALLRELETKRARRPAPVR